MAGLQVQVSDSAGGARIRLVGELDLAAVAYAEQALAQAEGRHPERVELDLSALEFIDSSGLRLLLRMRERAISDGRRLVLRRGSCAVQRVLEVTTIDRQFEFVD